MNPDKKSRLIPDEYINARYLPPKLEAVFAAYILIGVTGVSEALYWMATVANKGAEGQGYALAAIIATVTALYRAEKLSTEVDDIKFGRKNSVDN